MMELLGLPAEASAHAERLDHLTALVHWLMLILFVGWGAFFIVTLFRFRASRNPKADYAGVKSHASSYLEVAVALVEVVLLVGFSIPLWANRVDDFPARDDSMVVRVLGEQFAWNIHYPGADGEFGRQAVNLVSTANPMGIDRDDPKSQDDIVTINQMFLPIDTNVIVYVSTKDVIHSFALQHMRVKQDMIPGQSIPVWFRPTKTSEQLREEMVLTYPADPEKIPSLQVAMDEYKAADGSVIVRKMGMINKTVVERMAEAGITHYKAAPLTPTEITCAQLCGLGHYRMRGYYTIQSQADFKKWLEAEAEKADGGGDSYE